MLSVHIIVELHQNAGAIVPAFCLVSARICQCLDCVCVCVCRALYLLYLVLKGVGTPKVKILMAEEGDKEKLYPYKVVIKIKGIQGWDEQLGRTQTHSQEPQPCHSRANS